MPKQGHNINRTDTIRDNARSTRNHNNNNNNNNNTKNLRRLSHSLSWALRHAAPELGLTMSPDGFVPVQEILQCKHKKLKAGNWTLEDIQQVVLTNDKQRFKMEQRSAAEFYPGEQAPNTTTTTTTNSNDHNTILCIRANQGHSIPGIDPDLLLHRLTPDELRQLTTVVHGTYQEAWKSIMQSQSQSSGLRRMARNHIHFATGLPKDGSSVISGMRKSCDVYIFVDVKKCAESNIVFYRSDNGVILTSGINDSGTLPTEYFSHVTDAQGNVLLDNRH